MKKLSLLRGVISGREDDIVYAIDSSERWLE
jgi:hypothetical protein